MDEVRPPIPSLRQFDVCFLSNRKFAKDNKLFTGNKQFTLLLRESLSFEMTAFAVDKTKNFQGESLMLPLRSGGIFEFHPIRLHYA